VNTVMDIRVNKMLENIGVTGRLAASEQELNSMELVIKSYTVWDITPHHTTRCYISEDRILYRYRCENLKPNMPSPCPDASRAIQSVRQNQVSPELN
jgi:hypothetical protein